VASVLEGGAADAKTHAAAAKQLDVDAEAVRRAIDGLAQMMLECAKRALSTDDFEASVEEVQFSAEQRAAASARYAASVRRMRQYLNDMSLQLPHYADLSWRLDVQLASRCLRKQVEPQFLFRLETRDGGAGPDAAAAREAPAKAQVFQADYASVKHVVEQLEDAARQAHTAHAKRVLRYV
jgi:hypothetical protein